MQAALVSEDGRLDAVADTELGQHADVHHHNVGPRLR
jgi:hypothetical protein